MEADQVRQTFIDFMVRKGHKRIPSASLVPHGDPTMLFTSAGMVPFKPYFMGLAEPPATRLVTVQKVMRATDIDEVGDNRHLTFFEMLGNFSMGDYFKKEAIEWAWELLTDGFGLPGDRLHITIFTTDEEAHDLWRAVGVPEERIHRWGEEHNYWFSGDIGPCGPNSEIFIDRGAREACEFCRAGTCKPNVEPDCGRFLEVWNLVFMTLYQAADGSRTELPKKNIDTGSGLERVVCATEEKETVFETSLFGPVLSSIQKITAAPYGNDDQVDRYVRIVADHARAVVFLMGDGVLPSNDGRGYVLRRLIRRAIYYLDQITAGSDPAKLVPVAETVVDEMKTAYPALGERSDFIVRLIDSEEVRFRQTIERGRVHLDEVMKSAASSKTIDGKQAFALYDTYGYPLELTQEIAAQEGFTVDMKGFEREMTTQRERARAAAKFEYEADRLAAYTELAHIRTKFVGYDRTEHDTTIAAIIGASGIQDAAEAGESVEVVLIETPFYAEGGGQVADTGIIDAPAGRVVVEDTQAAAEGLIVHRGRVEEGHIAVNDAVGALVDVDKRLASQRNHTATHILHAALREVLGTHVVQSGSLVAPDCLRFDFTHIEATKPDELSAVQRLVNEKIRSDIDVHAEVQSYDEALSGGAMALFGEKYADSVRVVGICEPAGASGGPAHDHEMHCFSKELCGGTHVHRTGEIGTFLILSEASVGSGVRRIEALTGALADEYILGMQASVSALARRLNTTPNQLDERIGALETELDTERKRVQQLSRQAGRAEVDTLLEGAERVDGTSLVVARVPADSVEAMREMGDLLRDKLGSSVVVLGSVVAEKPNFLAMVSKDLSGRVHAGNLIKQVAAVAGGGGGGRPDMAQAGGKDPGKLDDALGVARNLARESLASK